MSHRRTVIEPAEGLTVLTGPNNCGKSALVLALQALAYGGRGIAKFAIRHGQKNAKVQVETSEGNRIEWVYENGSARYVVDGIRTDRSVMPDDLPGKLKLPEVVGDDGKSFDVHFAEQKDPIFLLGGGSRAATFFAASSDAGYLIKMQQLLRERKRDYGGLQRELTGRIAVHDADLAKFEPLPFLEAGIADLIRQYQDWEEGVKAHEHTAETLHRIAVQSQRAQANVELLTPLATLCPPPSLEDSASLSRSLARMEHLSAERDRAGASARAIGAIQEPPPFEDSRALESLIAQLEGKARHASLLIARLACVEELAPPELAAEDRELALLVERIGRQAAEAANAKAESETAGVALAAARDAIAAYIRENPTCPFCGGVISAEQVIAGGHVHA